LPEEVHNLYCLASNIRVIKSKRMRLLGCVAHVGEMRNVQKIQSENLKGDKAIGRIRN